MFTNTRVVKQNRSSSVLIRFDDDRSVSEFQLPAGFDNFPEDSFDLKKELFFKTYHCYRKFVEEKKNIIQKHNGRSQQSEVVDEDTVDETESEFHFHNASSGESITFQKLVMFDSILDAYDELRIQSLQEKLSKTDAIDYSRIDKYLHKAVYLQNDVIYIDEMELPKKILNDASTELVEMFSYIYYEIQKQFGNEPDNGKLISLANNFKENRLFEESSLFSEDSYQDTLNVLKEVLDEIDQITPYKDVDYWHFFDAVYNFLYSANDGTWQIDNFSFIWERMCFAFARKYYSNNISLYDNFGMLIENPALPPIKNFYKVSFASRDYLPVRYLRPDLVLKDGQIQIQDDFLERIFRVTPSKGGFDVSYNREIDISNYLEIDALKRNLFKDKISIQSFFNKYGKMPATFPLTTTEYEAFKNQAKTTLLKRSTFDLLSRNPCVVKMTIPTIDLNRYVVVDYKYMSTNAFSNQIDHQIQKTVKKQLVYEMALKLNRDASSISEFWIPGYLPARLNEKVKSIRRYAKECQPFFDLYRISVIQLDFLTLQNLYIQDAF